MKNESNQKNEKIIEIQISKIIQNINELEKEKNKVINIQQQIVNNKNVTLQENIGNSPISVSSLPENFKNLIFSPETLSLTNEIKNFVLPNSPQQTLEQLLNTKQNSPINSNLNQQFTQYSTSSYKPNSPQQIIVENNQQLETNYHNQQINYSQPSTSSYKPNSNISLTVNNSQQTLNENIFINMITKLQFNINNLKNKNKQEREKSENQIKDLKNENNWEEFYSNNLNYNLLNLLIENQEKNTIISFQKNIINKINTNLNEEMMISEYLAEKQTTNENFDSSIKNTINNQNKSSINKGQSSTRKSQKM